MKHSHCHPYMSHQYAGQLWDTTHLTPFHKPHMVGKLQVHFEFKIYLYKIVCFVHVSEQTSQSLKCGLLVQLSTIEVPTAISGLPAERSRLKNHKAKFHPEFTPSLWCRPLLLSGHGGIIIIIRLLFNWTREQHATHQVAPNTSAHSPNNIVWYQGNRCKRRVKTFEVDSVQLLTRWHQILTVQRRASSCDVENY